MTAEPQWIAHNPRYPHMPVAADTWVQVKGSKKETPAPPCMAKDLYWGDLADCDNPIRWYRVVDAPAAPAPQEGEREALARLIDDAPDSWSSDELADAILSLRRPAAPAPVAGLIAEIDTEMKGRRKGYADTRGELLFRCRDVLAALTAGAEPRATDAGEGS